MFDLGWTELLLIGIVALIVVGPKDLPVLFRKVGQFVGKAKGMAREFSRAMDEAADETGMKETANSLRNIADPKKMGLDAVKDATKGFKDWDPGSHTAGLAADRAEAAKKIHAATAQKAEARQAADAAKDTVSTEKGTEKPMRGPTLETSKVAPAKKTAAKKPAAKKPVARKPAAKKPVTKAAVKKPVAKAAAKKPTVKATARKPAAKATPAKKPASKSTGSKV